MLDAHISRMPNFYDNSVIHFLFPLLIIMRSCCIARNVFATPIKIGPNINSTSEYYSHDACHAASMLEQENVEKSHSDDNGMAH